MVGLVSQRSVPATVRSNDSHWITCAPSVRQCCSSATVVSRTSILNKKSHLSSVSKCCTVLRSALCCLPCPSLSWLHSHSLISQDRRTLQWSLRETRATQSIEEIQTRITPDKVGSVEGSDIFHKIKCKSATVPLNTCPIQATQSDTRSPGRTGTKTSTVLRYLQRSTPPLKMSHSSQCQSSFLATRHLKFASQ